MHGDTPRFVAEFETSETPGGGRRCEVIRRLVVPNSWAGDYHLCAAKLAAAVAFFDRVGTAAGDASPEARA
ncbi:hypothetical protein ASA1KI_14730 [Opitutales bacterium ASA1]|uniref:hypothetical protein n=1 Tax=Congregicoccus parvus TaxID=3081749 RepID=UPI002B30D827|nr:hypothetical protein ASA1KI_14730 [Opitutales bacterium ASA1]